MAASVSSFEFAWMAAINRRPVLCSYSLKMVGGDGMLPILARRDSFSSVLLTRLWCFRLVFDFFFENQRFLFCLLLACATYPCLPCLVPTFLTEKSGGCHHSHHFLALKHFWRKLRSGVTCVNGTVLVADARLNALSREEAPLRRILKVLLRYYRFLLGGNLL